ncbi:MAG TPA: TolC family protein [Terriglobia bacterium]|nr:TolC family protein [Terriglobia bacterium]
MQRKRYWFQVQLRRDESHWSRTRGLISIAATASILLFGISALRAQAPTEQTPPQEPSLQLVRPQSPNGTPPPAVLTLKDALERARKFDATYLSAATDAKLAHEDRVQARAAMLPNVSFTTQELLTAGNGVLPGGRYVTNDGVHVYRSWGVFHQDLSPNTYLLHGYRRASAVQALAEDRAEIARRGLTVTVTKNYYGLVVAQRKYATAQEARDQAEHYLTISRDLEHGGEVAHSDVIKAELQFEQQKQVFEEAQLAMENARLALAVMLSGNLDENFSVVDDLSAAQPLPPFEEARSMAQQSNPELRAAVEAMRAASLDVSAARSSFLPSITVDTDYGIEANSYALRSHVSSDAVPGRVLPNLGHFITAGLTLPIWDWGTLRSKLHQAQDRRALARVQLSQAQRVAISDLYSFYNEALAARSESATLHHAAELAAESLRLVGLRYRAGESTALELVDAQNALTLARNADDDGQARYRVALANLQTLTGSF